MNRDGILVLLSFFSFCFLSCESDHDNLLTTPSDLPSAIFALLNTAADSQYVIIRNSRPPEGEREQFIEAEYRRIRQAKVMIEGGGEQLAFNKPYEVENDFDFYHYRNFVFASAHKVLASETYYLRVEIPEKGVFTASATAPGDFDILAPNSVDAIDVFQPLEVRTTVPQGTAGYRVTLWTHVVDSTDFKSGMSSIVETFWARRYRYFSTSEIPVGVLSHSLSSFYENRNNREYDILQMQLSVEALDSAAWLTHDIYVDSTRYTVGGNNGGEEFRLEPVAFSNIDGGRGVMTAITTKTIPLRFPPLPK